MTAPVTGLRTVARVAERELQFFAAVWRAMAFSLFIAPFLYLVAMGIGLGGMMEDGAAGRPDLGGLPYRTFVAPGILVGTAAQFAAGSGLWPVMAGHRWLGFHRAMVNTPIAPTSIPAGLLSWIFVRSSVQAAVFLAIATAVGAIDSWWGVLAVPVAGLTGTAFAAPLMAYTASTDSDMAFDPIMRIVVAPLYLFSGAFFPLAAVPDWIAAIIRIFPLWHGIELARKATAGLDTEWPIAANLAVLAAWTGVGWLVGRRTFTTRLGS
ncbi:MAG: ABC transporter permease [Actinomycetota bacterium]